MLLFLNFTGNLGMSFELLLDVDEVVIILEPKEYQEFDFAMKRIIHNEMLDYYHNNLKMEHLKLLWGDFYSTLFFQKITVI